VIILDTNVISELIRPKPEPNVETWLDSQPAAEVATTAITAAELLYGAARLPAGRRRDALALEIDATIREDLRSRVEPFDIIAARQYSAVVCGREKIGRPISRPDAQIAAICRARNATLATRNTADFTDAGIELVNPWLPGIHELSRGHVLATLRRGGSSLGRAGGRLRKMAFQDQGSQHVADHAGADERGDLRLVVGR
jgi:predicted nucleic acid-binding protein